MEFPINNYINELSNEKGFYINNEASKRTIKEANQKLGIKEVAKEFKVSQRSIYHYIQGKKAPSIVNIIKIINRINKPKYKEQLYEEGIIISTKGHKTNELPKYYTNDLAYLSGVICGDGHISKKTTISVFSDSKEYLENTISKNFKKTFNCEIRLIKRDSCERLDVYSRPIHFFFNKIIGIPSGKKKGKLRIPKWVYLSKDFKRQFIKGIFDTDGGITVSKRNSRKKEVSILISSSTYEFLIEIQEMLKEFDIIMGGPYKSGNKKGLELRKFGISTIKKFKNEIGSDYGPKRERINALVAQSQIVEQ